MKTKPNTKNCPLTGQLLMCVKLDEAHKAANFPVNPSPSISEEPLPAPDSYQDAGGGYNRNFTFPQQ